MAKYLYNILEYQPTVEVVHLLIFIAEQSNVVVPEESKDAEGRTLIAVAHGLRFL
jgi:hypothetical protein